MRLADGVKGILFRKALGTEGAVVFAKTCELGLEGVVSKREDSLYRNWPSRNRQKTKNPNFVTT
jgi:ATP-dependent DNA ligase